VNRETASHSALFPITRMLPRTRASIAALALLSTGLGMHAELVLPAIFGNHMVLQQDKPLPVWGKASPGETITVTISEKAWCQGESNAGRAVQYLTLLPTLIVPGVNKPGAVRYAWADNPEVSLYNQAGLPMVPFRTDVP
jgi:hypothetical protein